MMFLMVTGGVLNRVIGSLAWKITGPVSRDYFITDTSTVDKFSRYSTTDMNTSVSVRPFASAALSILSFFFSLSYPSFNLYILETAHVY